MTRFRLTVSAVVVVWLAAVLSLTASQATAATDEAAVPRKPGEPIVYLLRGGADIFSTGLDRLAEKIRAKGVPATSLNFAKFRTLTPEIIAAYKERPVPIIIIGHSWGGNAAVLMANKFREEKVPIDLLVSFDATASHVVPPNVRWVINFRSTSSMGLQFTITGGPHYTGRIDTVDVPETDHIQVDKLPRLHQMVIDAVLKVVGKTPQVTQ